MGLFGGGYSKPGPGVDKNAPKKKGIFLYIEIFIRKFWKIIQTNLLYFLTSIPIIAIYYIIAPVTEEFIVGLLPADAVTSEVIQSAQMGFRSLFAIGLFTLWGSGPSTAAYTFIMRNFVREQHSWIFSDFFSNLRENFKQGIVVAIIDVLVVFLATTALPFYFYNFTATNSAIWLVACYAIGLALLIYTFMHYYIYQMMITFECSLSQLYRNAIIMAFAKLPMNIVFTILALVLLFIPFLSPMFAVVASAVIWVSFIAFPIIFYTSRVIQKNFLDNMEKDSDEEEIEAICSDEVPKDE